MTTEFRRTPFGQRILDHARRDRARREARGSEMAPPMFEAWTDGVFPSLARDAEQMVREDGVRLHSHAAAVNSSMVFGFNLFLPFRVVGAAPLAEILSAATGLVLRVERVRFEYGPSEILAETRSDPAGLDEPRTSSDIGVEVTDPSGRRGIVLLEVKLSEGGFTPCGGRGSKGNQRRDVCDSAPMFFAKPETCYLTRTVHAPRDRRYWEIFTLEHGSVRAAFPGTDVSGGCPFATDLQQPMRNHALALGLVQAGHFAFARLGLVHHDDNPDVLPCWHRYQQAIAAPGTLFTLPATAVIGAGRALEAPWSAAWEKYVETRYRIGGAAA